MPQDGDTSEKAVIARRKAAKEVHSNLQLSLGQSQSLPELLMTAPLAVNLLGEIKLLAFSEKALTVALNPPRGGSSISSEYSSLSAGMIQIVNETSAAFGCASRNLRSLKTRANLLFGANSISNDILMSLTDPNLAKDRLLSSMKTIEQETLECAKQVTEIQDKFAKVINSAEEASMGMADALSDAQHRQETVRLEQLGAETSSEKEKKLIEDLTKRSKDAEEEFAEAKKQFNTIANKGEASAFFLGVAEDVRSTTMGAVQATLCSFKSTPGLIARAFGSRNSYAPANARSYPVEQSAGIDLGLAAAESIEKKARALNDMLQRDAKSLMDDDTGEADMILGQVKSLKKSVRGSVTSHTAKANDILETLSTVITALQSVQKQKRSARQLSEETLDMWRGKVDVALSDATKLKSFALSRPGHGFESPATPAGPTESGFSRVLKQRHEAYTIKRATLNETRDNVYREKDKQLAAQAKLLELNESLKNLDYKKATLTEIKTILFKSINAMSAMKEQVETLAKFFNAVAEIVSTIGVKHSTRYLENIKAGFRTDKDVFRVAYTQAQAQTIRETLILLRGHFGFAIKSADLYDEIATQYIDPCMRLATTLPVGATAPQQQVAKQSLDVMALQASQAIGLLAEREFQSYRNQVEKQLEEIDQELESMGPMGGLPRIEQAAQEGIREAREEASRTQTRQSELFDEITEDL